MISQNASIKTIVMTGGTSGLGGVAAEKMARTPGVRLILGARNPAHQGGDRLSLDLERLASVHGFTDNVIATLAGGKINALVLNAASVFPDAAHRTVDGFETTFAVNHLAHYLLLRLLSPHLAPEAIVVVTTSNLHDPQTNRICPPKHADAATLAHPDRFGVPQHSRLAGMQAYAASKLCNLLTARAFANTGQGKTPALRVIAYNPGFTLNTGLMRNAPAALRVLRGIVVPVLSPLLRINTLETSSSNLADLALGRIEPPPSKIYASVVKRRLTWPEPSDIARRDEVMDRLWRDSARMTGLD